MKNYIHNNFNIFHYKNLESTNKTAFSMAKRQEIHENSVILSDMQSAGRGRLKRKWISEEGNLFFSLLKMTKEDIAQIQQISLIAAISLQKTLKDLFLQQNLIQDNNNSAKNTKIEIKNKWPNDIIINNNKIAGILTESSFRQQKSEFVIIGVGVNVKSSPENINFPACNLEKFSVKTKKEDILFAFLDNFEIFYQKWQIYGFLPIKNIWLENAYKLDEEIKINNENISKNGTFKGLDDLANMIIEVNGQEEIITFGDVS